MSNLNVQSLNGVNIEDLPSQVARAWVNFNGTGTVAILASHNVASIIDNGTANYTVQFASPLPAPDYAIAGSARTSSAIGTGGGLALLTGNIKTTSQLQVHSNAFGPAGNNAVDADEISVIVFA